MIYNFYIYDLYTRTEIVEPRNWKDLQSVFERDFNTHGVFFDYTDGTLKLGFSCEARDLLEAAYQVDGVDAYYVFEVTEQQNQYDSELVIFNGQIDFATRNLDHEFFDCEVNSSNQQLKFKSRKKTVINLNANKDLDGNTLANVNYDDSIRILAAKPRAELTLTKQDEPSETVRSTDGYTYYTVGLKNAGSSEILRFKPKRNYGYTGFGPYIDNLYFDVTGKEFLDLENDAELQLNISWDITATVTNVSGGAGSYGAQLDFWPMPEFVNEDNNKDYQIIVDSGISSPINLVGTDTHYISAKAGFKLALILRVNSSNPLEVVDTTMTVNSLSINIVDVKSDLGQLTQWYRLHDALNKNLSFLTGKQDYLYSELLGSTVNGYASDGCLANMFLTNGLRIRGLNDDKKAPSFSFNEFVDTLNAMEAIGYGFETLQSPIELGYKEVEWVEIVLSGSDYLGIIRISENLTSDITIGSKLGFYDNETIYGVYEVDDIAWNGSYTEIDITVTDNTNYYDDTYGNNPNPGSYTCYLTCDSSTEERERLRVERWEHFYNPTELIDLGVIEEYNEEPYEDLINEINLEFIKYANDEKRALTLEDFHTKSGWALPIEKSDQSKRLQLNWIGSTGLINESQFNRSTERPTTSHKLDDNLFFCDKIEKQVTATVDFNASGYIVMPQHVYDNYIFGGTRFEVTGSTSNNKVFHIDFGTPAYFKMDTEEWVLYVVDSVTTNAADSATFTPLFDGKKEYKPETTENMTSVSGLTEPEYAYNQRRTFKRMLLRWGAFIKSLVSYRPTVGQIKNLVYVNNGDFETDLDVSNLGADCYIESGLLNEQNNLDISTLATPIFKPNIINFTKKICDTDYELIKSAHRNSDIYDRNYGYITIQNKKGETKTGYLLDMRRSPIDRIAKVKMIERYV